MRLFFNLASLLALTLALTIAAPAHASIAYGSINNFDTVNDTGHVCHGFEIEIDDVHSTDITYTYDWNHYGTPKISEDKSDPLHSKVFIRYESGKNPDGSWAAYTAIPSGPIAPTDGHMFTDPSVNFGGEHYGVGYYGTPTAVKYNWLIDDGAGNLTFGGAVNISTPTFTYQPPILPAPGIPAQPAKVQAAIVLPPPPVGAPLKEFGDAMWVKEIKTQTHNNSKVELRDLIDDAGNNPNGKDWKNGEPDEIEIEWQIMQTEFAQANGGANGELQAAPEDLPNGDEVITRRYEFYKYVGPLDAETNEVMTDSVGPDGIHGNNDYADVVIVGDYIGAQMAGFDAAGQLGLIDHLQPGDLGAEYVARTMVVNGTPPVQTTFTGVIPAGMNFDAVTGILSGTPQSVGLHQFTLSSTDGAGASLTKSYDLVINAPVGEGEGEGEGEGQGPPAIPPLDLVAAYNYLATLLGDTSNDMNADGICDSEQLHCLQDALVSNQPVGLQEVFLANRAHADTDLGPAYVASIPGLDSLMAAWTMLGMDAWVNYLLAGSMIPYDPLTYDLSKNPAVAEIEALCVIPNCGIVPPVTRSVTTSAAPLEGGTTTGGGTYNDGDSVTLVATPTAGWSYLNWTIGSDLVSADAIYTFNVSADVALVANFSRNTYHVTTSAAPAAGGTTSGGGDVAHGDATTVNAVANAGYTFVNWTEAGVSVSNSASYTFVVTGSHSLVANFARITYSIDTSASPGAGGTASGGGTVSSGDSVTVVAAAASGYTFSNWTETGSVVSTSASYTFTASGNRRLVANFARITYSITTSASPVAGGSTSGGGTVNSGDSTTVTASANAGYSFVNWTEDGVQVSADASYNFAVLANRTLLANFARITYNVATASAPAAGGSTSGDGTYNSGDNVSVVATANVGYNYLNWSVGGQIVSSSSLYSFPVNGNVSLVANFELKNYTISTSSSPAAGGSTSGGGSVKHGDSVTVIAAAASGYSFTNWTEAGSVVSTSTSYTFTASGNRSLVANFARITYAIRTSSSPVAGGSTSGGGTVNSGDSVTVVAAAASGYTFSNWTEAGSVVSTSASYTFTAGGNRSLVANFARITYTISTSSSPVAGGLTSGGGSVNSGDSVTVVATAASGYTFTNWTESGVVASTSASYTFAASANRNLVANFTQVTTSLTVKNLYLTSPTKGGLPAVGVVILSGAAPAGGVVVKLASSNTGVLTVPATVTVPAGKSSVAFLAPTKAVKKSTVVTVTATLGSSRKTDTVNVLK